MLEVQSRSSTELDHSPLRLPDEVFAHLSEPTPLREDESSVVHESKDSAPSRFIHWGRHLSPPHTRIRPWGGHDTGPRLGPENTGAVSWPGSQRSGLALA